MTERQLDDVNAVGSRWAEFGAIDVPFIQIFVGLTRFGSVVLLFHTGSSNGRNSIPKLACVQFFYAYGFLRILVVSPRARPADAAEPTDACMLP